MVCLYARSPLSFWCVGQSCKSCSSAIRAVPHAGHVSVSKRELGEHVLPELAMASPQAYREHLLFSRESIETVTADIVKAAGFKTDYCATSVKYIILSMEFLGALKCTTVPC